MWKVSEVTSRINFGLLKLIQSSSEIHDKVYTSSISSPVGDGVGVRAGATQRMATSSQIYQDALLTGQLPSSEQMDTYEMINSLYGMHLQGIILDSYFHEFSYHDFLLAGLISVWKLSKRISQDVT